MHWYFRSMFLLSARSLPYRNQLLHVVRCILGTLTLVIMEIPYWLDC